MRTDSVHLSEQATKAARECVSSMYGKEYLSNSPRQFNSTARNAQEAHEALGLQVRYLKHQRKLI